jgi:hypothetical protein
MAVPTRRPLVAIAGVGAAMSVTYALLIAYSWSASDDRTFPHQLFLGSAMLTLAIVFFSNHACLRESDVHQRAWLIRRGVTFALLMFATRPFGSIDILRVSP